MSQILKHIKNQIFSKNRNYTIMFVAKPGMGKSWSAMRLGEALDPTFNIDRVVFKVEDLLKLVQENELNPGSVILFDEAGIGISNRQHYMNKFNKSMSFLLQTWRHRNLILLVTVPDIAFVDKGVRKLFDALAECMKVVKSKGIVRVKWKFIQVNPQSGEPYFHGLKTSDRQIILQISKPSIGLRRAYEKKKSGFTTTLYKTLVTNVSEEKKANIDKTNESRRCPNCGLLCEWRMKLKAFKCRACNTIWKQNRGK